MYLGLNRFGLSKYPRKGSPTLITAPVLSGTAEVGETLTATAGTWSNAVSNSYQWQRDGSNIAGATGLTYVVTADDADSTITFNDTATNGGGSTVATSNGLLIASYEVAPEAVPLVDLAGAVAVWDGKQYSGSGNWLNQIASGSAYDVTPENTSLHNGLNSWVMDNASHFTLAGSNTALLNGLHKTTGGTSATFAIYFQASPDFTYGDGTHNIDSFFGTAGTDGNYGVVARVDSSLVLKIDQYDGTTHHTLQYTTVTDSAFNTGTGWTFGTGWAYGSSNAAATASSGTLSQTLPVTLVEGNEYIVRFTVGGYSAGSVTPYLGGTAGSAVSANGTATQTITAGSSGKIEFVGSGFTGTIDSVIVRPGAASQYSSLVVSFDADNNKVGFAFDSDVMEWVDRSSAWGAATASATNALRLAAEGDDGSETGSGVVIFGGVLIDHAITDTELTLLNASLRAHYTPPDPVEPDQATKIVAQAGDGAVYFNFVADDGGAALTDCKIEYSLSGADSWSEYSHAAFGETRDVSMTSGLTNGTAYDFRLTPQNSVGYAASPSDTVTLTPVAAATEVYDETVWAKITLPVTSDGLRSGNAAEVLSASLGTYNSAFFTRQGGNFKFLVLDGGAATKNTVYCRTEFKGDTFDWDLGGVDDNEVYDEVTFSVDGGVSGKKVITHQVHDTDAPWVKITYTVGTGQLRALWKIEDQASSDETPVVLLSSSSLGSQIKSKIVLRRAGVQSGGEHDGATKIEIDFYVNDTLIDTVTTYRTGYGGDAYFKAGAYNQDISLAGNPCYVTHYEHNYNWNPS